MYGKLLDVIEEELNSIVKSENPNEHLKNFFIEINDFNKDIKEVLKDFLKNLNTPR